MNRVKNILCASALSATLLSSGVVFSNDELQLSVNDIYPKSGYIIMGGARFKVAPTVSVTNIVDGSVSNDIGVIPRGAIVNYQIETIDGLNQVVSISYEPSN
jgi:hypothetical protein